jgi:dolichol-phosphate mannosyltransferase
MNIPQPIKFCIVGASGVIVNTVILFAGKEYAGIPLLLASGIAILTAMLWNFYWNDAWTFAEIKTETVIHDRLLLFVALCSIGAIINEVILIGLVKLGMYYLLANLAGIAVATSWNYLMNKKVTWG